MTTIRHPDRMANRICRQHRRRDCSTCRTASQSTTSADTSATDAALWAVVSDYGSGSYGDYGGGSSCGGSSGGD